MRKIISKLILIVIIITNNNTAMSQTIDKLKMHEIEHQLFDVMEIIDTTYLKAKLKEVEADFKKEPNEINKVRLGIIYHETALNLGFLSKTTYIGYAKRSYDVLNEITNSSSFTNEYLPFVVSYKASALSLMAGETKKLNLVGQAFVLFEKAVTEYAAVSYVPEFMRGSVAENLPFFFFNKRKFAKTDMESIITKQGENSEYANNKIMSFVYWSWANQHQVKKYREQSLKYIEKAIALDPNYEGGRKRAEELKVKLLK